MTLKEYIKGLLEIKDPKLLSLPVVTSSDDEGNQFNDVLFSPTIGKRVGKYGFTDDVKPGDADCICVN